MPFRCNSLQEQKAGEGRRFLDLAGVHPEKDFKEEVKRLIPFFVVAPTSIETGETVEIQAGYHGFQRIERLFRIRMYIFYF
jgi:hypothetical protein